MGRFPRSVWWRAAGGEPPLSRGPFGASGRLTIPLYLGLVDGRAVLQPFSPLVAVPTMGIGLAKMEGDGGGPPPLCSVRGSHLNGC